MKNGKRDVEELLKPERPKLLLKRIFAFLIDVLIINLILIYPFRKLLEKYTDITNISFNFDFFILVLVICLITLFYFAVFEYYFEQTFGKLIFKLKVSSRREKPKFIQTIIRNLSKISIVILIIDCVYLLNRKGQRVLEKISNTRVMKDE
ncbi:MAG: RDD family protein [Candidatus Nanoarchaeia archaeon]|nr:RDD family protein [Candidatus Nanoarchaeia archaeon]